MTFWVITPSYIFIFVCVDGYQKSLDCNSLVVCHFALQIFYDYLLVFLPVLYVFC